MKKFQSINPYTQEVIETFEGISDEGVIEKIETSAKTFQSWRKRPIRERAQLIMNAAQVLRDNKDTYSLAITQEMGKPIKQSLAEIEKCAWACNYYAENAEVFLKDEIITTDAQSSYVMY